MDFLAIGDIVTEPFIRLFKESGSVACDSNNEHCRLSLPFPDKVPYESMQQVVGVGNAPNAAVAAARLGLSSTLISWIGDDHAGEESVQSLEKSGVSTTLVTREPGKTTNHHFVLWYGPDRSILVKHESFEYAWPTELPVPRAVYLSSIGEAGISFHEPLVAWLSEHPDILFAFQPGTFQIAAGLERLAAVYARTNVFVANKEEYQRILQSDEEDPKKLMEAMRAHGPKTVFLTDGPLGAYALSDEGAWKIGLYPDHREAYERTGAGDAFASTVTAMLVNGATVPEALRAAPVNSMSVVQKIGAQAGLITRTELDSYLAAAPEYQPEQF